MSLSAVQDNQPFLATGIPFAAPKGEQAPFANGADTPSFWDLVDVVNPLQHIPVVSTLYRAITGDEIGAVPRIVGDTLFGGPLGLIGAVANEVVRRDTGQDIGAHALAMLLPGQGAPQQPTQIVDARPGDMAMQPFDDAPVQLAANIVWNEPPAVQPQPLEQVSVQSLQAPASKANGAISGSLFQPLNKPIALADEPKAAPAQADEPAALAPVPAPAAAPVAMAAPDKIVPQQATLIAQQMANTGELQPLLVKQAQPSPPTAAEPKKFESKVSALSHGKMYAAAAPYTNKVDPAQKVAQAQGIPADHPMLKAAGSGQNDWMAGAMAQALDKYSRTQKMLPDDMAGSPPS
jgi:hypothetical protein